MDFVPVAFPRDFRELLEVRKLAAAFRELAYCLHGMVALLQVEKEEFRAGSADRVYPA